MDDDIFKPPAEVLNSIDDATTALKAMNNYLTCRNNISPLRRMFGACSVEQKAADDAVAKAKKSLHLTPKP